MKCGEKRDPFSGIVKEGEVLVLEKGRRRKGRSSEQGDFREIVANSSSLIGENPLGSVIINFWTESLNNHS